MEKAIEIKRRAQRCIQNGDLDGALAEYEKLVGFEDSDPYNYVLLADLLYKKGEQNDAAERYLSAVAAYEKASLYKNAIAVCKKMMRLSLSPAKVLQALANLHALDGLAGEAALYYVQYAEHMVRSSAPAEAAHALRKAFDVCQDNIKVLEQLSEAWLLAGDQHLAAQALVEAGHHYKVRGQDMDAQRCVKRAATLDASVSDASLPEAPAPAPSQTIRLEREDLPRPEDVVPEPGSLDRVEAAVSETQARDSQKLEIETTHRGHMGGPAASGVEGFDSGRHHFAQSAPEPEAPAAETASSPSDFAASEEDLPTYEIEAEPEAELPAVPEPAAEEAADEDVYEIDVDDEAPAIVPEAVAADESDGEPVYEIEIDETDAGSFGPVVVEGEESAEEDGVVVIDESTLDESAEPAATAPDDSSAPGLQFGTAPVAEPEPVHAHHAPHAHHAGPNTQEIGLQQVEALLTQAQEQFRAGDRETASATLARAAQAYEILGRFDSAATIYRSLGRSASVSHAVLELWLVNCERRGDQKEAATVACEMGDRALNAGDESEARRWFERAVAFDAGNETAKRRLSRLAGGGAPGAGAIALAAAPAPDAAPLEGGRVEVAVGRGEAVTFDLSGLLAEFQRGVEAQLAGDAQSHYDLGMTYREMGLLEQAVDSFRVSVGDPRLAARALEMIGRCHVDQGRWAEAVGEFRRALQHPMPAGGDGELRYHYAHALVELGETESALTEYEHVAAELPGYEDVDERIVALRRVLGRA